MALHQFSFMFSRGSCHTSIALVYHSATDVQYITAYTKHMYITCRDMVQQPWAPREEMTFTLNIYIFIYFAT